MMAKNSSTAQNCLKRFDNGNGTGESGNSSHGSPYGKNSISNIEARTFSMISLKQESRTSISQHQADSGPKLAQRKIPKQKLETSCLKHDCFPDS